MLVQYVTQDEASVFIGGNLPFIVLLFLKKKKKLLIFYWGYS